MRIDLDRFIAGLKYDPKTDMYYSPQGAEYDGLAQAKDAFLADNNLRHSGEPCIIADEKEIKQ